MSNVKTLITISQRLLWTVGTHAARTRRGEIDVDRLKQLVGRNDLVILERRGMVVVGPRDDSDVQIRNAHPSRAGGKGRGDQNASASWNRAKWLFIDQGDVSFNGYLIAVVQRCDGVDFVMAATRVAEEAGVAVPLIERAGAAQASPGVRRPYPDPHETGSERDRDLGKKLEAAKRKWAKAGPLRDSFSESYLQCAPSSCRINSRGSARMTRLTTGYRPEPAKVATMPALVAAPTVEGGGDPVAVIETFFGHPTKAR